MFTIPNEADVGVHANQSEPDAVDFGILTAAHALSGVVSGCAVTAQGTPDMTVAVALGVVSVAGVEVAVAAGNVTITAADATNPRFDLIVVDDAGAKSAVAGTAAANPVYPAIPADSVVLAAVYVPANETTITSGHIVDKRVEVGVRKVMFVPFFGAGSQAPLAMSGWVTNGREIGSSVANSNNRVVGMLHYYRGDRDIDALSLNVQTAADTTGNVLLALYDADGTNGHPGTLVKDAGVVVITSTGTKEASFAAIRPPKGMYWVLMFTEVGGSTIPKLGAPNTMTFHVGPIVQGSSSQVFKSHLYANVTYPGTAPSTAPTMAVRDTADSTGGAFYLCIELA